MAYKQGWYKPKHPEKYVGDVTKIRYMSSWEHKMHQFLDNNPNILQWSSEEIKIPYMHPFKKKVTVYLPDYWVKYKNKKGKIIQEIIEVKPSHQTRPTRRRKPKQRLYEQATYAINIMKWRAAQQFCDKYNIKFRLLTEKELFK